MNANPWFQLALYLAMLFLLAWPLGRWIDGVLAGRMAERWRWTGAIERVCCAWPARAPTKTCRGGAMRSRSCCST